MQHSARAQRRRKRQRAYAFLIVLTVTLLWLSLVTGAQGIRPDETSLLLAPWEGTQGMIFSQIRLPRALAAFLAGAALGLSGTLMQGSLRNPLASPYTLGISQAAGFGAAFAIIVLHAYNAESLLPPALGVAFCAFATSLLCSLLIIWLGRFVQMRPGTLILLGVALGSLFNALTMFLQYFADDLDVAATLFWTFGDMGKADWNNIAVTAALLIPVLIVFWRRHWYLDALGLGDESAKSLGVPVERFRLTAMLLGSLLAAVAVAFFGIIGFVGLVAPHMIRLALGETHATLLPLSALGGGCLLMAADLAARLILLPVVIPVGILTAFLGVPLFVYLLIRQANQWR